MSNLWSTNHPSQFWQTKYRIEDALWQEAIRKAAEKDPLFQNSPSIDTILFQSLGEGRFGSKHWDLPLFYRLYWRVKPLFSMRTIRKVRSLVHRTERKLAKDNWPIDDRYVRFQWEVMRQLIILYGGSSIPFADFWPNNHTMALVLTHDVESVDGQKHILAVADLEEKYGFCSSFNIIGSQLPENPEMFLELKDRGFEIGIHGWHHTSGMYSSRKNFNFHAIHVNRFLQKAGAVGMRSPLNLRNPEWMQALNIEYDLSFFDTDPFEPISGGAMSIWPFFIGHFVELPATLVQDNTLVNLLGETSPQLWMDKIAFLEKYHGMALVNCHPDYLSNKTLWNVYERFLAAMQEKQQYWNALPRDVARWWKIRSDCDQLEKLSLRFRAASLLDEHLMLCDYSS